MKTYKAYCFDLDGTVYRGKDSIPSAVAFIHQLQAKQIEPYYVTNNSSKTREQLQAALQAIGIHAPLDHIYSSALVTATYIRTHYPQANVYVVGSDGIRTALQSEGITITEDEQNASVIVMGMDRQMTYEKIAAACRVVQNGAVLIGTNEDIKFPSEQYFYPGNGSFVQLVGNVSGVIPITIGKPSPLILETIAMQHQLSKDEMVMVGDNYATDILCGIQFGCDTIHVNTGVTPTEQVKREKNQPTYCVEHLTEEF